MRLEKKRGVAILDAMPEIGPEESVFGKRWGSGAAIQISRQEIKALLDGKVLAIDVECEYLVYIQFRKDVEV
ncbi:hypothetical protein ACQAYK_07925 [Acidithiobacillus sp. AC3]